MQDKIIASAILVINTTATKAATCYCKVTTKDCAKTRILLHILESQKWLSNKSCNCQTKTESLEQVKDSSPYTYRLI